MMRWPTPDAASPGRAHRAAYWIYAQPLMHSGYGRPAAVLARAT
ncbi:hypothetical protein XCR_2305 [Xanthomonas campestris pv. raphani 756C]|nr:hypothetical protein XCR_2305 [Xanthomonas campestris pv. raphani 756C]